MKLIGIVLCIAAGLALAWLFAPSERRSEQPEENTLPASETVRGSQTPDVEQRHENVIASPAKPPQPSQEAITAPAIESQEEPGGVSANALLRTLKTLDRNGELTDEEVEATLELLEQLAPEDQDRVLDALMDSEILEEAEGF